MYKQLFLIMIISIFNPVKAQQTINPHISHDWENSRYIVNTDNTVLDHKTNLIWKKCAEGLIGSDCTGSPAEFNWEDSLNIAENSAFADFSDWRLPNIKELRTLVAYDRYNPAININIFPNTPSGSFWSSTPYLNLSTLAWRLDFDSGGGNDNVRSRTYYVRLVRFKP